VSDIERRAFGIGALLFLETQCRAKAGRLPFRRGNGRRSGQSNDCERDSPKAIRLDGAPAKLLLDTRSGGEPNGENVALSPRVSRLT